MLPLGYILRHLHVKFHCYAEDQQIYIEFFIGESGSEKHEECLVNIFHWMRTNFMMCNTDKTEKIIFSPSRGQTSQSHVGDFNIHMDNEHDHKTKSFRSMLDEFGLKQHVNVPTHMFGHVLELVISDQAYPYLLLENGPAIEGYVESDHFPLCFQISWMKPPKPSNSIKYRSWKTLNKETFKADLTAACLTNDLACDTNAFVEFYNKTLIAILEKHLPLKEKVGTEHANCPYHKDVIRSCKTERRRLERRWRQTKDPNDRQNYVMKCREMNVYC